MINFLKQYQDKTFEELVNSLIWFDLPLRLKAIFAKVNTLFTSVYELEEQVENLGSSYKVYTALLTQSGTDAPVATVLENTLGTIAYSTIDGINNKILSTNLFTENKTYIFIGNGNDSAYAPQKTIDSDSLISFSVSSSEDAMLNTPIEIRVYN